MGNDHKKAFVSLFNDTARYRHRYEVFKDFVMMAGISMHNAVCFSETLEKEYMSIVSRYKKDDVDRMPELFAEVVLGLECHHNDFLGSVYMELDLGSSELCQIFTPFNIAELMAECVCGDSIEQLNDGKPFITLSEPAAGGGSMVIAFAKAMLNKGFNPQQQLWVSCVDIDPLASMMCYLQLSLLHIPAEVVTGDTLAMTHSRVMRTPAHYLGFWDHKLSKRFAYDESIKAEMLEDIPLVLTQKSITTSTEQLSLFDMVI